MILKSKEDLAVSSNIINREFWCKVIMDDLIKS